MRLTLERPSSSDAAPAASVSARMSVVVPALVVFLAFGLRMVHLAYESFDLDEADGATSIAVGLEDLIRRLFQQGQNGPLYYLLLGIWAKLAGTSEFALRFPSVVFGTTLVALCYASTRRLLDCRAALLTAVIAACSTYLIHYAQMVKMYALVALLALLASDLLLRALDRPSRGRWAAYVIAVSVAMYTHIFGVLLLAWHIVYVLLRRRAYRPALRGWLAATALLTLPYVPLGLWHVDALKTISLLDRQFTGPRDLLTMLATLAREYGTRYDELPSWAVAGFFLAAAGLGFLALRYGSSGERRPAVALFLGLGVAVPLLAVYALTRMGAPLYSSRYLIVTLPPFLLLWGAGLAAISRRQPLLLVPTLGMVLALNAVYLLMTDVEGVRYRENWREAVAYLDDLAQPGDAVTILNTSVHNAYRYYSRTPLPVIDMAPLMSLEEADRFRALAAAVSPFRRVLVMFAYFEVADYSRVRPWLEQQTHIQEQRWFRGVRVAEHVPMPVPAFAAPAPTTAADLSFGRRLQVVGFDRGPLPQRPGQPFQVRLYWRALVTPDADYAVSLRLADASGNVWGRSEGPIGSEFHQTSGWQPGRVVPDERKLRLLPGTPPGTYRLGMLVYRRDPLQNLPVDGAGAAEPEFGLLDTVTLERPAPWAPEALPGRREDAFENGARLVGVELPDGPVVAGHDLPVILYWLAPWSGTPRPSAELSLIERSGRSVAQQAPLGMWSQQPAPETLEVQRFRLPVPGRFGEGPHRLELRLLDGQGRALRTQGSWRRGPQSVVGLGDIDLAARPRSFALPGDLIPPAADLSDGLKLLGLRLSGGRSGAVQAGSTLNVTLVWQASGEPQGSYTTTVQLVSEAGRLLTQHDDRPAAGAAPTESWQQGEVVEDPHPLAVPQTAPPGRYRLIAAAYDATTKVRLRTSSGEDQVVLGTVEVGR